MKLMKYLALSAMLLVAGCAGSAGNAARERALLPPLRNAWPAIEEDIARGVADGIDDGDVSPGAADALMASTDRLEASLLELEDARIVAPLEWPSLHPFASRGVLDRVDDGEIGEGVGESFEERIEQFDDGIKRLAKSGR